MDVDLKGRVVFVTGAAGAIGRATVRRLADNGASVVVADINGEGAKEVAAELPDAIALTVDIRRGRSGRGGGSQDAGGLWPPRPAGQQCRR